MSVNVVALVGRLTRDPEIRETKSGKAVGGFTLAVDNLPDKNGEKSASFINVVVWDKLAEVVGEYTHKGDMVGVSGRLNQRTYEDKDGNKRTSVEVIASEVQFMTPKKSDDESDEDEDEDEDEPEPKPEPKKPGKPMKREEPKPTKPVGKKPAKKAADDDDDDLPF